MKNSSLIRATATVIAVFASDLVASASDSTSYTPVDIPYHAPSTAGYATSASTAANATTATTAQSLCPTCTISGAQVASPVANATNATTANYANNAGYAYSSGASSVPGCNLLYYTCYPTNCPAPDVSGAAQTNGVVGSGTAPNGAIVSGYLCVGGTWSYEYWP